MENDIGGMVGTVSGLISFAIAVVLIAANWKLFTKANKPGWACLIPIYNIFVFIQIIGRPVWWIVLFFIPLVNFIVAVIMCIDLAKSFGKDTLYGIGILFLSFIFMPMLAFGSATYQGPSAAN